MSTPYHSLTADQVKVGDKLPELRVPVTATTIVMGAAAARDWQPQHHDSAWAKRVGTQDIFLNTPAQGGWISRYVTDWTGPTGRIARLGYRMKSPIYPGDLMVLAGTVSKVYRDQTGCCWVDLSVEAKVGDSVRTTVNVTVALPEKAGAETPWMRGVEHWQVAQLPPHADAK